LSSPLTVFNLKIQDRTSTGTSFVISGAAAFAKDENVIEVTQIAGNLSRAVRVG